MKKKLLAVLLTSALTVTSLVRYPRQMRVYPRQTMLTLL